MSIPFEINKQNHMHHHACTLEIQTNAHVSEKNTHTRRYSNDNNKHRECLFRVYVQLNLKIVVVDQTIRIWSRRIGIEMTKFIICSRITKIIIIIGIIFLSMTGIDHTNTIGTMTFFQDGTEDFTAFIIHWMSYKEIMNGKIESKEERNVHV